MVLAAGASGNAETYDQALKRYRPVTVREVSVFSSQPSRFLTQAVELRGCVIGVLRSDVETTVLLRLDGGRAVHLRARPEQTLLAAGQYARIVARLAQDQAGVLIFDLLAMTAAQPPPAPGAAGDVRTAQAATRRKGASAAAPAQPRYTLPSRGAPQAKEDRVLDAYERAIAYFNPRLSKERRRIIAGHIIDFSRSIGVDARLVMAVVAAESNFNASATSRVGAMGLGQLMPATARGMGVSNAYDTRQNLWAAVRIVRGHLERNEGDIALALACYNAGPGAVRKYGGVPPYRETQNYIRKVISIYLQLAPEMAR
jgi:soluble lytic murein transglycosylase-like protein